MSFFLEIPDGKGSLLRGWEYPPTGGSKKRVSPRLGNTGKPQVGQSGADGHQDHTQQPITRPPGDGPPTVARVKPGDIDKRIVSFGGEQKWYWMTMSVKQPRASKDYHHITEQEWRQARPFGIDYRDDSPITDTHKLVVRLDGTEEDLTDSGGT